MVYDSTIKALSEWRKRMGIAANNCGKRMKRIIIGRLFLTPIRRSLACMTFTLSVAVVAMSGCRRPVPTIAVIPRTCGTWLWEAEHTGVERAAPAYGLSVYWNAPMRDDDVQGQIEILTHALDRGAPIHLVQATLNHQSVATTGRYLHARPSESSGSYLTV